MDEVHSKDPQAAALSKSHFFRISIKRLTAMT
jgi:hypothetical protein